MTRRHFQPFLSECSINTSSRNSAETDTSTPKTCVYPPPPRGPPHRSCVSFLNALYANTLANQEDALLSTTVETGAGVNSSLVRHGLAWPKRPNGRNFLVGHPLLWSLAPRVFVHDSQQQHKAFPAMVSICAIERDGKIASRFRGLIESS